MDSVSQPEAYALRAFEAGLDPGFPEKSAVPPTIIGYGEVSTTFVVPDLPGLACKRMAGFADASAARSYADVIGRYVERLRAIGIRVVETRISITDSPDGMAVVYLLQPMLDVEGIGHKLLHTATDEILLQCVERVFEYALLLHRTNTRESEIAVDAQLSNWHFTVLEGEVQPPLLFDVGTPFMRRDGVHELDTRFLLAPVPQPIRWYYQRQRAVEKYLDDYFDTRKLLVDLVCNFYKEGRPDRIPVALNHINMRLAQYVAELHVAPITATDVEGYYRQDVASLELYMRVRKLDRFVRTRLLRQRYKYTLPGPVQR